MVDYDEVERVERAIGVTALKDVLVREQRRLDERERLIHEQRKK